MKSVLVTGGTRRLGAAIALRLANSGWRVIASSHRTMDECAAFGDIAVLGGFDLSREGAADELYERAAALAGGRLDAIVNNAALFRGDEVRLMAINATAPKRLMELALARGGAVVNILDTQVLQSRQKPGDSNRPYPDPNRPYLDSKRALLAATQDFAKRSSPSFRVSAVAPGPVLAPEGVHEKAGRLLTARPTPADIADAVALLLDTPSITGAIIPVDAGQHLL